MSASLVGSEMCIRDREFGNVGRRRACGDLLLTWRRLVIQTVVSWKETVSYTHLTLPTICSV
eukprot:2201903-Alexandrium_andersonii.AAC.1